MVEASTISYSCSYLSNIYLNQRFCHGWMVGQSLHRVAFGFAFSLAASAFAPFPAKLEAQVCKSLTWQPKTPIFRINCGCTQVLKPSSLQACLHQQFSLCLQRFSQSIWLRIHFPDERSKHHAITHFPARQKCKNDWKKSANPLCFQLYLDNWRSAPFLFQLVASLTISATPA